MSNWHQLMPTEEAYWLNKVLFELHHQPEALSRYLEDPVSWLRPLPLTDRAREAIIGNDVAELYLCGVNPYLLRAHCIGMKIPEQVSVAALRSLGRETGHG